MAKTDLVVFENTNNELRNVPRAFKARNLAVRKLDWEVEPGDIISADKRLAVIYWEKGAKEDLMPLTDCVGKVVTAVHWNANPANLKYPPSVYLLRFRL